MYVPGFFYYLGIAALPASILFMCLFVVPLIHWAINLSANSRGNPCGCPIFSGADGAILRCVGTHKGRPYGFGENTKLIPVNNKHLILNRPITNIQHIINIHLVR